ncbi:MAG: glycosyltransferase [Candidatus Omnitrophica bacterium]|nr:glycosyltransferase [Candidatus Omnitrophota bacterium]
MKKLIIQIPCYNEASVLPHTLKELPRKLDRFDTVEWLVIDDGSTDNTIEVARNLGVDHIVRFTKHQGLARAFMAGLETCLKLGADVIVNTDADNQYNAKDIPKLISPILEGNADMVIGSRSIENIEHFSFLKKRLHRLGSYVVRWISRTEISDAPSGFRALSKEAAMRLNVFNDFTYTLETIIQAGQKNMAVLSIPITVNEDLRPSRLIKSIFSYIIKSLSTIVRIFVVYKPFRFFFIIGLILFSFGFLIGIRYLYYYLTTGGAGHIQSLILAAILLGMGFQTIMVAFIADLLSVNRKLLEDIQYQLRKKLNETMG